MSPAATGGQPLQHFIHYDFDALRMEIAGSLMGRAAQEAYEAWQTAKLLAQRVPLVVDISYVTEADEDGRALLQAWRRQGARIVASSFASRAVADSIRSVTAGNPAFAEDVSMRLAGAKQKGAENAGFPARDQLERQVRK